MPYRRILFATDFSPTSVEAGRAAAELSATFKAPLLCVHVIQFPNLVLPDGAVLVRPETMASILGDTARLLEQTRRALVEAGASDVTALTLEGDPFREIGRAISSTSSGTPTPSSPPRWSRRTAPRVRSSSAGAAGRFASR